MKRSSLVAVLAVLAAGCQCAQLPELARNSATVTCRCDCSFCTLRTGGDRPRCERIGAAQNYLGHACEDYGDADPFLQAAMGIAPRCARECRTHAESDQLDVIACNIATPPPSTGHRGLDR